MNDDLMLAGYIAPDDWERTPVYVRKHDAATQARLARLDGFLTHIRKEKRNANHRPALVSAG